METGSWLKVLSGRQEKLGIELAAYGLQEKRLIHCSSFEILLLIALSCNRG